MCDHALKRHVISLLLFTILFVCLPERDVSRHHSRQEELMNPREVRQPAIKPALYTGPGTNKQTN